MRSKTYKLAIGDICIDVIKKDVKKLRLGFYYSSGRVRIAAPLRTKEEAIREFAVSKIAWINKQKLKFQNLEPQTQPDYVTGESHYYKGEQYLLNVFYQNILPEVEISDEKSINLFVRPGSTADKRKTVLREWYRAELKKQIANDLDAWQNIVGVEINDWAVKNMKTRWGSCNIKAKRIWLNLELIKKPAYCLDFIIVHELVHLLERNHNAQFKSYMDSFLPQWRQYKKELNGGF
jgi:predicted metal-dependent hydrolase